MVYTGVFVYRFANVYNYVCSHLEVLCLTLQLVQALCVHYLSIQKCRRLLNFPWSLCKFSGLSLCKACAVIEELFDDHDFESRGAKLITINNNMKSSQLMMYFLIQLRIEVEIGPNVYEPFEG